MKFAYWTSFLFLIGVLSVSARAQDEVRPKAKAIPHRFGYDLDETTYPQKSPKEAMNSVVRSIDRRTVDYMLAHVADPHYVDYWIERYMADFTQGRAEAKKLLAYDRLVRETNQYFEDDPKILKDLRIFAKEAEWTENEDVAVGIVKTIASRKVFMRRIGERWFLENRQLDKAAQK